MHFHIILNRDGGTLRTLDLDSFCERTVSTLEQKGHQASVEITDGDGIVAALERAMDGPADVVMAGGGDGTISAAASMLQNSPKALAVLPAGTMNLFARSLAIPLDLDAAVASFADGTVRSVDLGSANGQVFVHQFSVGLHAKLIRLREKATFRSRLGKIWASLRAGVYTFVSPPRLKARLEVDGRVLDVTTAGIGITNNLFGEGHLPYADTPDDGVLGVYVTLAWRKRDLARFVMNMALGRWKENAHVDIYTAETVTLRLMSHHRRFGCAIDGELHDLAEETTLKILPGVLKVLIPPGKEA
jgi:diacylglycerol kinase family enzyme